MAAPRFRMLKSVIRPWLKRKDWSASEALPPEAASQPPASLINPLFACLPEGEPTARRAAIALGQVMGQLYAHSPEEARNVIRRFMWHMNEESGNIGWGIPVAFGQTLAQCPPLANAYHRILFSYIHDKEGDSTFCDHAPLRRSCFTAIGDVLEARPDLIGVALPLLRQALADEDAVCRELAAALIRHFSPKAPAEDSPEAYIG